MALVLRDRVKETTSTAGTGTYSLAGAVDGFESFGSVGNGNTTYYGCSDGIDFEVGIGTFTASGTTLARTTILQSSNSDSAVNWGTGTRTIFCTLPAEKMSFLDASGNLVANNASALTNLNASNIASGTVPIARLDTGTTAGKMIVLDGSARLPAVDGSQLFNVATGPADITADSFTGNNSTTAFTITTAPAAADDLLVTINGLIQRPTTDYTVSGTTLTFTSVPFTGANIFSRLIGGSESTNGDLLAANNLSDLASAATARTNLGLGTAATTASTDYATAAQGTTADAALPRTGGAMTGAITTNSTFDGRDVATDGAKLDGIEAGANVTDAANVEPLVDAHLNTSTASSSEVLSWTGTDYDWVVPASGADLYAANPDSATDPTAGGLNSVAIGNNAVVTDAGSGINGSKSIAIGHNSSITSANAIGAGRQATVSGAYASGFGYKATSAGTESHAATNSYASGTNSFAAAIADNTSNYGATGANSIAMGKLAKASSSRSIAIGAYAESSSTSIALNTGWNNTVTSASGANSVAIGGNTSATSAGSFAFGQQSSSAIRGKYAYAAGQFAAQGDAQGGQFILRADTTDATATALTTNNATAAADNQIILPNTSAYSFSGTLIAREDATDGSDYAAWEIKGALLRDANAASTVLGNGVQNKLYATAGASAWAIALTADTTNGGLKIEVTGAASTNIRWVATVNTSEVTYA